MKKKYFSLIVIGVVGIYFQSAFCGQVQYEYDSNDQVVSVTAADSVVAQYDYDPAHNLSEHLVTSDPSAIKSFLLYLADRSGVHRLFRFMKLWPAEEAIKS